MYEKHYIGIVVLDFLLIFYTLTGELIILIFIGMHT